MASRQRNNKYKKTSYFRGLYLLSTYTFAGLITVFSLTAAVAPAMAAYPAASGNTALSSLKDSTNPDIVRTLALLRKQTEQNGTTRIIVGLRVAFTPEGELNAASAAQQRNEIARMRTAVLRKVPSLKQRPESIKQYESIPFIALEVNAAELEALANLTEIVSIEEDRIAAPTSGIEVIKPESK
jgi:hypothetical protein